MTGSLLVAGQGPSVQVCNVRPRAGRKLMGTRGIQALRDLLTHQLLLEQEGKLLGKKDLSKVVFRQY